MAEETRRPRRLVARAEGQEGPRMVRHTVSLPVRTSGLLAYYAKTRGLSESNVVAQALAMLLRGMRVSDPGINAGEEEQAA